MRAPELRNVSFDGSLAVVAEEKVYSVVFLSERIFDIFRSNLRNYSANFLAPPGSFFCIRVFFRIMQGWGSNVGSLAERGGGTQRSVACNPFRQQEGVAVDQWHRGFLAYIAGRSPPTVVCGDETLNVIILFAACELSPTSSILRISKCTLCTAHRSVQ